MSATTSVSERLRILCLHGHTQNGIIFNKKSGVLRKSLKDVADFVYVTAPLRVMVPDLPTIEEREADTQQELSEELTPCTWWFSRSDGAVYREFENSIAFLKGILETEGPFDGILGFSQGATMASLLTALLERPHLQSNVGGHEINHGPFRFSMIFSGFKAIPTTFHPLYSPPIDTPSLHVIGKMDTIISPERSQLLTHCFVEPMVQLHDGGHFIPSNAESRKVYKSFIAKFVPTQLSSAL